MSPQRGHGGGGARGGGRAHGGAHGGAHAHGGQHGDGRHAVGGHHGAPRAESPATAGPRRHVGGHAGVVDSDLEKHKAARGETAGVRQANLMGFDITANVGIGGAELVANLGPGQFLVDTKTKHVHHQEQDLLARHRHERASTAPPGARWPRHSVDPQHLPHRRTINPPELKDLTGIPRRTSLALRAQRMVQTPDGEVYQGFGDFRPREGVAGAGNSYRTVGQWHEATSGGPEGHRTLATNLRSHVWPFGVGVGRLYAAYEGAPHEVYGLDKDWLDKFPYFPLAKQPPKPKDEWCRAPPAEWREFSPRYPPKKSPLTNVDDGFIEQHMARVGTAPSFRRYPEYYDWR